MVLKLGRTNHKIDVVCPLLFQVIKGEVGEGPWTIALATYMDMMMTHGRESACLFHGGHGALPALQLT